MHSARCSAGRERFAVPQAVAEAAEILKNRHVDLVLSESRLPEIAALELVDTAAGSASDSTKLILTGHSQLQATAEALCKSSTSILQTNQFNDLNGYEEIQVDRQK
jgi:DNA-binding NtrC family response regulator